MLPISNMWLALWNGKGLACETILSFRQISQKIHKLAKYQPWKTMSVKIHKMQKQWSTQRKYWHNVPISGMPYIQHLRLDGKLEGNWHIIMKQASIPTPTYYPPTYPLWIPQIPVMHSVWQEDMSVPGIHKELLFQWFLTQWKRVCMPFEWIETMPTKYQPLGEGFNSKSPSFLQHPPPVCKVGHTTDRYISLLRRQNWNSLPSIAVQTLGSFPPWLWAHSLGTSPSDCY